MAVYQDPEHNSADGLPPFSDQLREQIAGFFSGVSQRRRHGPQPDPAECKLESALRIDLRSCPEESIFNVLVLLAASYGGNEVWLMSEDERSGQGYEIGVAMERAEEQISHLVSEFGGTIMQDRQLKDYGYLSVRNLPAVGVKALARSDAVTSVLKG